MNKDTRVLMVTFYLFFMAAFLYLQPDIAFGREGRVRPFGTQEKEATIFPLWWWIFVIAVVAYMLTFFVTRSQMFQ
jgi:Zn-dependent protease with chaperone function